MYLVATGTRVVADAALALDKAVGKESIVGGDGAEGLRGLLLLDEAIFPQFGEDVLDNLGVLVGWGASEDVEIDPEPVVDVLVDGVILGAKRGRVYTLLERFRLGCGAVLIGAADVQCLKASRAAEARKHVGRLSRDTYS